MSKNWKRTLQRESVGPVINDECTQISKRTHNDDTTDFQLSHEKLLNVIS